MVKHMTKAKRQELFEDLMELIIIPDAEYDDDTGYDFHEDEWGPAPSDNCNCEECLLSRAMGIYNEFLLEKVYTKLPEIPRNYDADLMYYNNSEVYHMNVNRRTFYLIDALHSLRMINDSIRRENRKINLSTLKWEYCIDCGRLHKPSVERKLDEGSVCRECFTQYRSCACCGIKQHIKMARMYSMYKNYSIYRKVRNDMYRATQKEMVVVCSNCYATNYRSCRICGFIDKKEEFELVHYRSPDAAICKQCQKDHMTTCDDCGERVVNLNHGGGTINRCGGCLEARRVFHEDHRYKPRKLYFMRAPWERKLSEKTGFWMGFEYEIEPSEYSTLYAREAMAGIVCETFGTSRVYCVHDGTVRNGIEVVTMPFSWDHYRSVGKSMWTDLALLTRKYDWTADSKRAGFHVHTTKEAWGTYQTYKLLQFFHNKDNFTWIDTIAGRKPTDHCQRDPNNIVYTKKMAKEKKNVNPDHYAALNMNSKTGDASKTIEFRMFDGSSEPLIIHKNIEFVRMMYIFTKDYPLRHMTPKMVTRYIKANKNQYSALNEYMTMKGL